MQSIPYNAASIFNGKFEDIIPGHQLTEHQPTELASNEVD